MGVCFIAAGIYIEKLARRFPSLELTSYNVHRLIITSLVIAIKFFDDASYSNECYSKVTGVSCLELSMMEMECLQLLNFKTYVRASDIREYIATLVNGK